MLMMPGKILLFYKYVDLQWPERIVKWQKKLCSDLDLRGRIIVSHEGINGTVGGTCENVNRYKEAVTKNPLFSAIDFKESDGGKEHFPRMRIVAKKEIVHFGVDPKQRPLSQTGTHLKPKETHALIAQHLANKENGSDLVIFDARNKTEWRVGAFKDALMPDIRYFRELPAFIEKNIEQFKGKRVLMYCTGGIRCEPASAFLKQKGVAREVYQLEGGIHRYVEEYPDGFFRGKNYVFDERITVRANNDVLARCDICTISCDDYQNCLNASCNAHFICCPSCKESLQGACSTTCKERVASGEATRRPRALHV